MRRRGPGRPKLRVTRTERAAVFFTKGEYRTVRSATKKAGQKRMGTFIRQMILASLRKKGADDG